MYFFKLDTCIRAVFLSDEQHTGSDSLEEQVLYTLQVDNGICADLSHRILLDQQFSKHLTFIFERSAPCTYASAACKHLISVFSSSSNLRFGTSEVLTVKKESLAEFPGRRSTHLL